MENSYALVDFHGSSQVELERALSEFTQLRNFHNGPVTIGLDWGYVVYYIIADIVAKAANRTLIAPGHPQYYHKRCCSCIKFPVLFPFVSSFHSQNRTAIGLHETYNKARTMLPEAAEIIRIEGTSLNFVYCSVPKRKTESIWNFAIFTHAYDAWTWLSLIFSFICVSLMSFSSLSFLSTLSVLISPGVSGLGRKSSNSKLFIVWMLVCANLCTIYTGFMSSSIISPSPEDTLSDLADLHNLNYDVAGEGTSGWITILRSVPYRLKGKIEMLRKIYMKHPLRHLDPPEVVLELAGKNKVAILKTWFYALGTANHMNDLFEAKRIAVSPKKKCYVGKELVPLGEIHYVLAPPGTQVMRRILQRLISSGIDFRWLQEVIWMMGSSRIQDRARILSPTKIMYDKVGKIKSLKMKERVLTIFVLWATCLVVCWCVFTLELCWVKIINFHFCNFHWNDLTPNW